MQPTLKDDAARRFRNVGCDVSETRQTQDADFRLSSPGVAGCEGSWTWPVV